MANKITIDVTSHADELLELLGDRVETALEMCGIRAEELAVGMCPVDTGLLHNSITYALDGQSPKKGAYKADRGDGHGEYGGQMPKEGEGVRSVSIGTNVEYAAPVEMGASGRNPQPFLKPAIQDHKDDYAEIIRRNIDGGA